MKKGICCTSCIAAVAGGILLAVYSLSPQLMAKDMVPYKGAGWGWPIELTIEWPTPENPQGRAWGALGETGEATHVGKFQARADVEGYFGYEGDLLVLYFTGSYLLEAADGSTITASIVGREPMLPFPCPFTMTMTIVSGTGRLLGATGSWEVSAISTGDYTFTAEGMISSIGSVRSSK